MIEEVSVSRDQYNHSQGGRYHYQAAQLSHIYGFTDFHLIPRDRAGIFMFYNSKEELLFVGKARKLRPRIKKHFEDRRLSDQGASG